MNNYNIDTSNVVGADKLFVTESGERSEPIIHEIIPILLSNDLFNYPNPFNPETTISFTISDPTYVRLDIYNIKGQKVKSLVKSSYDAGNYKVVWNGTDDTGRLLGSGVYFYRMTTPKFSKTKKMLLLK